MLENDAGIKKHNPSLEGWAHWQGRSEEALVWEIIAEQIPDRVAFAYWELTVADSAVSPKVPNRSSQQLWIKTANQL